MRQHNKLGVRVVSVGLLRHRDQRFVSMGMPEKFAVSLLLRVATLRAFRNGPLAGRQLNLDPNWGDVGHSRKSRSHRLIAVRPAGQVNVTRLSRMSHSGFAQLEYFVPPNRYEFAP